MSTRFAIGNVFKVELSDGRIRFFQFIGKDVSELNGDVIAIFKRHYLGEPYEEEVIVRDEVECFMHTSVGAGIKMGLWRIAFTSSIHIQEKIVFRTSLDIGLYPFKRKVSHRWVVWQMNEERKFVGTLPKEYYNADLGGIYAPIHVISRLETGEAPDKYYPLY